VKDGRPVYTYNWLGLRNGTAWRRNNSSPLDDPLRIRLGRGGAGKGGLGTILVNGQKVADAASTKLSAVCSRLTRGQTSTATPVTEDYNVPIASNGVIDRVTFTLGETPEAEHAASDAIVRKIGPEVGQAGGRQMGRRQLVTTIPAYKRSLSSVSSVSSVSGGLAYDSGRVV
jgi:hypothetical protein